MSSLSNDLSREYTINVQYRGASASADASATESIVGMKFLDDLVPRIHYIAIRSSVNESLTLIHPSSVQSGQPIFGKRWCILWTFLHLLKKPVV